MLEKRFTDKVEITHCGCWRWVAARDGKGYGRYTLPRAYARERGISRNLCAHRYCWESLVGPIPDGLELDHLCRNRLCVNPDHLEPVAHVENVRRGVAAGTARIIARARVAALRAAMTHCSQGHEFTPENSYYYPGTNKRKCRQCNHERWLRNKPPKKVRTHCRNGHPATPENTHLGARGYPTCRACNAAAARRYRQRQESGLLLGEP